MAICRKTSKLAEEFPQLIFAFLLLLTSPQTLSKGDGPEPYLSIKEQS